MAESIHPCLLFLTRQVNMNFALNRKCTIINLPFQTYTDVCLIFFFFFAVRSLLTSVSPFLPQLCVCSCVSEHVFHYGECIDILGVALSTSYSFFHLQCSSSWVVLKFILMEL